MQIQIVDSEFVVMEQTKPLVESPGSINKFITEQVKSVQIEAQMSQMINQKNVVEGSHK